MIITKSKPFTKEEMRVLIGSLAMDLLRVALGLRRGSLGMAKRFREEALKRQDEILSQQKVSLYLKQLLTRSSLVLQNEDEKSAEDLLMYSTLFQNFARK